MKRQEDLVNMASGIVAERELITRRLVTRAAIVIIAFELVIAIVLGWGLWQNHKQGVEEECHVLEHRINAKGSFGDILEALDRHSNKPVAERPVVDPDVLATYGERCAGRFELHQGRR